MIFVLLSNDATDVQHISQAKALELYYEFLAKGIYSDKVCEQKRQYAISTITDEVARVIELDLKTFLMMMPINPMVKIEQPKHDCKHLDGSTTLADGSCRIIDHSVSKFEVSIRTMGSVGPLSMKDLIQTKYEVVEIKEVEKTTFVQ